nr:hypothetical protein [Actinomycetales bacterium]
MHTQSTQSTLSTPSTPTILAAHRYVSSHAPARTRQDIIRRLNAYALKNPGCPADVVDECAIDMAYLIHKERCILIPVPDHNGNTAANTRLAEAIALHARCSRVEVRDILTRAEPVESTCARHRHKLGPLPVEAHRIVTKPHQPFHLAPIYFVDNVATSGNTLAACAAALHGFGTGLVYADASR